MGYLSNAKNEDTAVDPAGYESPDLPEGWRWRDAPVAYHGEGEYDRLFVYPGRRVLEIPGRVWPAPRPEECQDISGTGEWVADDSILVCRGCGLDCT